MPQGWMCTASSPCVCFFFFFLILRDICMRMSDSTAFCVGSPVPRCWEPFQDACFCLNASSSTACCIRLPQHGAEYFVFRSSFTPEMLSFFFFWLSFRMSQQHAICSGPLSRSEGCFWIAPKVLCLSQNQRKSGQEAWQSFGSSWHCSYLKVPKAQPVPYGRLIHPHSEAMNFLLFLCFLSRKMSFLGSL